MPKGQPTTSKQQDEVRRLREQGMTYPVIAQRTGISPRTVARMFANGIKVTRLDQPEYTPDSQQRVSVSIDAEQASSLMARNPRLETTLVAGAIQQQSLKSRLLRQICEGGPFDGVIPLMDATRRGPTDNFGAHEVTHILRDSLGKQGLVTFRTHRIGKTDRFSEITATEAGRKQAGFARMDPLPRETMTSPRPAGYSRRHHAIGRDGTEAHNHGAYAIGGPVERVALDVPTQDVRSQPVPEPVAPVAVTKRWPVLEALRERAAAQEASLKKAHAYYEAAVALVDIDPDESARMERLGDTVQGAALTDTEQEYLAYAKEKGC